MTLWRLRKWLGIYEVYGYEAKSFRQCGGVFLKGILYEDDLTTMFCLYPRERILLHQK